MHTNLNNNTITSASVVNIIYFLSKYKLNHMTHDPKKLNIRFGKFFKHNRSIKWH